MRWLLACVAEFKLLLSVAPFTRDTLRLGLNVDYDHVKHFLSNGGLRKKYF